MTRVALVVVNVPLQTVDDEVATESPTGSVSLTATPLNATVLADGFVIVKVSDTVPLRTTELEANAAVMVGAATTVRVAVLLVEPVPLSVEEIAPVVLLSVPAVLP